MPLVELVVVVGVVVVAAVVVVVVVVVVVLGVGVVLELTLLVIAVVSSIEHGVTRSRNESSVIERNNGTNIYVLISQHRPIHCTINVKNQKLNVIEKYFS